LRGVDHTISPDGALLAQAFLAKHLDASGGVA
jgi:hypothetical protein